MYEQRSMAKSILDLFYKNPGVSLTEEEIAKALDIGKHQRKVLKQNLFALVRKDRLIHEGNLYSQKMSNRIKSAPIVLEGVFDASSLVKSNSYAFVNTKKGDYYIPAEDIYNAFHGDTVLVEERRRAGRKLFGRVLEVKKRRFETLTGDIVNIGDKSFFIPDSAKIHTYFELEGDNINHGHKVLIKVKSWGNRKYSRLPIGIVKEDLGMSGNPETDFLAVVKQYNLSLTFPAPVLKEIHGFNPPPPHPEGRRKDFTDILTFTIDPVTAKDFDDAISIAKVDNCFELYVHIADVAEYVTPESAIFKEASKRGNSFYFPKQVIPMLPEILSNKTCSLRPQEQKNVVSCYFKLDMQGNIINQFVTEAVIESNYRFNYEEVDAFLDKEEPTFGDELDQALIAFKELSLILQEKRVKQGYLQLNLPETNFKFDDESNISSIYEESETISHQMIENAMLLANELVARRLKKNMKTSIYRVHDMPDEERIEKLKSVFKAYNIQMKSHSKLSISLQNALDQVDEQGMHDVFDMMVLRSMKRAMYITECKPHFGLAISSYTHFTSPIRRFSDLIVHTQLKQILNSDKVEKFSSAQLGFYAKTCTEQENLADETEREITNRLVRSYMKKYIGHTLKGKVIELNKNKVIVKLFDEPVKAVLEERNLKAGPFDFDPRYYQLRQNRGSKIIRLGDTIEAIIDRITDDIYLTQKNANPDRANSDFNPNDPRNPYYPPKPVVRERRGYKGGRGGRRDGGRDRRDNRDGGDRRPSSDSRSGSRYGSRSDSRRGSDSRSSFRSKERNKSRHHKY